MERLTIGSGGVDMPITVLQRPFHCMLNLPWLRLPGAEPDGGHRRTGVELDGLRRYHSLILLCFLLLVEINCAQDEMKS